MAAERLTGLLWEEVAPYEQQAKRNHDQSLEELARRGGLDPIELWCVVNDVPWREVIPLGVPHKRLGEIAVDCEEKLIERFGTKLRVKVNAGRKGPK